MSLPERAGLLLVVIRHLLFGWERERLCTEIEHRVDFVAHPVVLKTATASSIISGEGGACIDSTLTTRNRALLPPSTAGRSLPRRQS